MIVDQLLSRLLVSGEPAKGEDGGEHVLDRVGIQRHDLGSAPQVSQRVVDHGDVDCTHRAQVLGDDHIGIEARQCACVKAIEILAVADRSRHERVDLGRDEALGQRGGRHDRA